MKCRQMRWCLCIYLKSHKLYEDLHNSGGLKLPSRRTLSNYHNYCSPQTGWKTENLKVMREQFQKKKPPKHARLGRLYFDEMKIKEALSFQHQELEAGRIYKTYLKTIESTLRPRTVPRQLIILLPMYYNSSFAVPFQF